MRQQGARRGGSAGGRGRRGARRGGRGGAGAGARGGAHVWASVWARCVGGRAGGREEGEARSAVLYWGSLTVPRAEAAGTRGRGVPGDGAWHWDVRAPDTVSTPPIGSARALLSGASHPAPSPWVELGSTQGVVWCGVVWCGVVWCGVVWCGVVWCGSCRLLCCIALYLYLSSYSHLHLHCIFVLCCAVLCCVAFAFAFVLHCMIHLFRSHASQAATCTAYPSPSAPSRTLQFALLQPPNHSVPPASTPSLLRAIRRPGNSRTNSHPPSPDIFLHPPTHLPSVLHLHLSPSFWL